MASYRKIQSVKALENLGRERLSKTFFFRDFLFSDIAAIHGLSNIPDDPELAIKVGKKLCGELLEPIQDAFGRIAIRSAYRSAEVNGFGNEMQQQGKSGYKCANNEKNAAKHIWDMPDANGFIGATACIVVPDFADRFRKKGDWQKLAWWIHDELPYSSLVFFPIRWAFNISWHERPEKRIDSRVKPFGTLTKPGMDNHDGTHEQHWRDIFK